MKTVGLVMRQAALAAAASSTPVPSTPYGPTSRISRAGSAFSVVVVIGTSFQFGLEVVCEVELKGVLGFKWGIV